MDHWILPASSSIIKIMFFFTITYIAIIWVFRVPQAKLKEVTHVISVTINSEQLDNVSTQCPYYSDDHGMFDKDIPYPRFIITGGAGFIGSHVVKRLNRLYGRGHIKIIDNLVGGKIANLQYDNNTWAVNVRTDICNIDLRNSALARKYIRGANIVYHMADVMSSTQFLDNIIIDTNTLQASKCNNVTNYIYVGAAYNLPVRENKSDPDSAYGWSKLMGEYEANLVKNDDFNVGIIRLYNVYGPQIDYINRPYQIISNVPSTGINKYYDFVYIDDVVDALLLMLEKGMNKGVIQIGSGTKISMQNIEEIVYKMNKSAHVQTAISSLRSRGFSKIGIMAADIVSENSRAHNILGWYPTVDIESGIAKTIDWITRNILKERILIVLIGQPRGGELAWKSLHKHVLRPYNAHLATLFTDVQQSTILQEMTQYEWTVPEYDDWGVILDEVAKTCPKPSSWRKLCNLPTNMFLGSVANCTQHKNSAGILLSLRWIVQQKMSILHLFNKYDKVVLSRADELYVCDHYSFSLMKEPAVYLPYGEYYGGWSDRHMAASTSAFMQAINITTEIICNTDMYSILEEAGNTLEKAGLALNIEAIQKIIWNTTGLPVIEFNRSMFTVKTPSDATRWSGGGRIPILEPYNLLVKYRPELELSIQQCNIDTTQELESIKKYEWRI